jgi:hypothetical protein
LPARTVDLSSAEATTPGVSKASTPRGTAIPIPASSSARFTAAITSSRERRTSTGRDPVHHVTSNSTLLSPNDWAKIWTSCSLLTEPERSTAPRMTSRAAAMSSSSAMRHRIVVRRIARSVRTQTWFVSVA